MSDEAAKGCLLMLVVLAVGAPVAFLLWREFVLALLSSCSR